MSDARRIILFLGLAVVVAFCLRPPYQQKQTAWIINREVPHKSVSHTKNIGHHWIWNPPQGATKEEFQVGLGRILVSSVTILDWSRLGVYVGLAIAITLVLMFGSASSKRQSVPV